MSRRFRLSIAVLAVAATLLTAAPPATAAPAAGAGVAAGSLIPATPVMDGRRLLLNRVLLAAGDRRLRAELKLLTAQADPWLTQGPWSVTDKTTPAAGGDIHDYLSRALYFWPTQPKTPDNPKGCPYSDAGHDGVPNPEVYVGTDKLGGVNVLTAVPLLSLAWYYTRNPAYARHAALLLRTWYVDPATRMNPNLNYAQGIVCKVDGRSIGIIDFAQFFTINLDAMALLDTGAPGWTGADRAGMRAWNESYLDWLVNSPFGKAELATTNNHGSFAAMQIAGIALALGQRDLARTMVDRGAQLIDSQIKADGTQPLELARTRTWHYSNYNLSALTRLATIGRHLGVNLWDHRGPDGQSLFAATDYLVPAAAGVGSGDPRAILDDLEQCVSTCPSVMASSDGSAGSCVDPTAVFGRARSWLTAWSGGPVPYLSSNAPGALLGGYRRDCSGYVSMALGLPGPGLNTVDLAAHSTVLTKIDVQPGDLMINPAFDLQGHVVLFERWADASRSRYWGYEQSGDGGTHYREIPYPYFGSYPMKPYRFEK